MLLYDIFYYDDSFSPNVQLPARPLVGTKYALNTNGDGHCFVPFRGRWVDAVFDETLDRWIRKPGAKGFVAN